MNCSENFSFFNSLRLTFLIEGGRRMDLLIRDIDPRFVKQLDEQAEKQMCSRQELLKGLLTTWCADGIQSTQVARLERQLEANTLHLKRSATELERLTTLFREVMQDE